MHAAETLAMKVDTLTMICWICIAKAKDEVSLDSLFSKHGIQGLDMGFKMDMMMMMMMMMMMIMMMLLMMM